MAVDLGKIVNVALAHRDELVGAVKAIRALFGKSKTGPEKLAILKDFVLTRLPGISELLEGLTERDLINDPVLNRVVTEIAQTAYDLDALENRLRALFGDLKQLRGTGAIGDGTGVR